MMDAIDKPGWQWVAGSKMQGTSFPTEPDPPAPGSGSRLARKGKAAAYSVYCIKERNGPYIPDITHSCARGTQERESQCFPKYITG